jgi:hypothetical protein
MIVGNVGVDPFLDFPEAAEQSGVGEGFNDALLVEVGAQRTDDGQGEGSVPLLVVGMDQ